MNMFDMEKLKYPFLSYINNILIYRRISMRKGLSEKELAFISELELKSKYFFTLEEISHFFTSKNERGVYMHRLRKKGRVVKLNKSKYYLVPVKAVGSHWSEHPFILIDEMMNSRNYCIVGKAAAYHWKLIDQIPLAFEVWNTKKHGIVTIFNARLEFKKHKKKDIPQGVVQQIQRHSCIVASKGESKRWR